MVQSQAVGASPIDSAETSPTLSAGQGNRRSSATVLGSTSTFLQLQALYRNSRQWNQAYRASPKSACSKSIKSGSKAANLCAGSTNSKEALDQYYQLLLSTSPHIYSSTDRQQTGGLQLVSPPGSQDPCQTCTAFAVAAAAETAMATALGVDVSQCSISVQALFFCSTPITRSCSSGWTLPAALEELQRRGSSLPTAACLPYKPGFRPEDADRNRLCTGSCSTASAFARQGSFSFVQILNAWEAQSHIRQHGAVLTPFDLYPGFDAFFRNASNAKAVYRPPPGAVPQENHAVLLVGYDNDRQFWLARNSWGVDWGDGGLFRVAFDTCAVLTPGSEAYGVIWTPKLVPDAVKLPVAPAAPQHPGCYWYKARPGDYLSRVARLAGIPLEQFMLDNTAVVKDLDAPITGLQLLLCKPNPDNIIDATKPVDKQLQSLLKIKAFIDTAGVLTEWSKEESGADAGYCNWRGVICTQGGKVVEGVNLWTATGVSGLQGVLPPSSAFDGLPGLWWFNIADQPGIAGTLPPDWSRLQQLQDVRLGNNSLTGMLPPSWAKCKHMNVLYLNINQLRGPLPDAWSGMVALEELSLHSNALTGSLPPSWSQMQSLKVFYVNNNKIRGLLPDSFKALKALQDLQLHSNSLSGTLPPAWSQMRALKILYLHNNTLRGPLPAAWSSMTAMEDLGLHMNALTGSLPSSWGQLKRLREFWAFRNKLRGPLPDSFKALTNLQDLRINGNLFSGALPPSWGNMLTLKTLYLYNNTLQGPLPAAWSGMAALEDLGLSLNTLTGSLPPTWGRLSKLRELGAYDNKLSGPLREEFKTLTALELLELSGNTLTGTLPPSWGDLHNLQFLSVWSNNLHGPLPDAYKSLTQLEQLRLSINDFSGVVPPSWQSMTSLKEVDLYSNPQLHGCLPNSWEKQMSSDFAWQTWVYDGTNITGFC